MPVIDASDDEIAVIQEMRRLAVEGPATAKTELEDSVYVHLIKARAELYLFALMHGRNDLSRRHELFLNLLSAEIVCKLCDAWHELRDRRRDDETLEN